MAAADQREAPKVAPAVGLDRGMDVVAWRELLGDELSEMQMDQYGGISYRAVSTLEVLDGVLCVAPSQVAKQRGVSTNILRRFILADDDPVRRALLVAGGSSYVRQFLSTLADYTRDPEGFERVAAVMSAEALSSLRMFALLCAAGAEVSDNQLSYFAKVADEQLQEARREMTKGKAARRNDRPVEQFRRAWMRFNEEDAVSCFDKLSPSAKERLLAAAGLATIRIWTGLLPIEQRQLALNGAERALARDDLTSEERSNLLGFHRGLTDAVDNDAAVAFAWEKATWRTRQLVEIECPLFVTDDGTFDDAAFPEVLRRLAPVDSGNGKSGRPAKHHGRVAFDVVRDAYLAATGLRQPDWTRTPKSRSSVRADGHVGPSGPFTDYLRRIENHYGLRGVLVSEL